MTEIQIVRIYRGMPRNSFYIDVFAPSLDRVVTINEYELETINYERLLTSFGTNIGRILLERIQNRLRDINSVDIRIVSIYRGMLHNCYYIEILIPNWAQPISVSEYELEWYPYETMLSVFETSTAVIVLRRIQNRIQNR